MERDAFLENVYDNYLNYENIIRTILSTDFNRFLTNSLTSEWNEVIQLDIPILKKYKTPEEFVNKSSVYLKNKAQKILRKIQKMNYIHGNL